MKQTALLAFAILSAAYGALTGSFGGLALGAFCILLAFSSLVKSATPQDVTPIRHFGTPWGLLLITALGSSVVAA